jgi:O-antigen ligase
VEAPSNQIRTPLGAPGSAIGTGVLLIFLFLLFSRVCDLALASLHLPLISSLAGLAVAVLSGGVFRAFMHPVSVWLMAYTGWLTLTIVTSVWQGGSFAIITGDWYKSILTYLLVVALVVNYDQARRASRVFTFSLGVLAILVLFFGTRLDGRITMPVGQYANPNELGHAMLTGAAMWWWVSHDPERNGFIRTLAALMVIPTFYVIVQTGSRAGVVALVLVLPILFRQYSVAGRIKLGVGLALMMAVMLSTVSGTLLHRMGTLFGSDPLEQFDNEAVQSSNARLELLKSSLSITLRHPLFGVGAGNFVVVDAHDSEEKRLHPSWHGTHNTYTQISSEAGIPALIFFVGALVSCWRSLSRARKLHIAVNTKRARQVTLLCAALKMVLLICIVEFCFTHMAYSPIFPAIAGLIVAVTRALESSAQRTAAAAAVAPVAPLAGPRPAYS